MPEDNGRLDIWKDWLPAMMVTKSCPAKDIVDWNTYCPYILNIGMSLYRDCIIQANMMNTIHNIPVEAQFSFYKESVRAYKRSYVPWPKKIKDEDLELIQKAYNCNRTKAETVSTILTSEQLASIRKTYTIS